MGPGDYCFITTNGNLKQGNHQQQHLSITGGKNGYKQTEVKSKVSWGVFHKAGLVKTLNC